jgi:hypothetical protein
MDRDMKYGQDGSVQNCGRPFHAEGELLIRQIQDLLL